VRTAIITLTGQTGSGKTTKVRALVEPCRRALIVDPEGKWPLGAGDTLALGGGALLDQLGALGASDPAVPFRVVYRDDAERMQLAAFAVAFAVRNLTLVVDEYAWLCTAWDLPTWFKRVLQFGRERRINLVGTTREPQEVHDMLFSQAGLRLFFHTDPGNGLDRIRRRYPALANELPTLALHAYRAHGDEGVIAYLGREGLALPPR
jgi:hypothetical protein